MVTSVRTLLLPLPPLLLCSALAAQHDAPAFVLGRDCLVRLTVDDVPSMIAALPQSRLGQLLAEPECADMLATVAGAFGKRCAALTEASAAAAGLGIAWIPPLMLDAIAGLAPAEFRGVDLAVFPVQQGGFSTPACYVLASVPAAEGRWTRRFDAVAASLPKATQLQPAGDKVLDFPGRLFAPKPDADSAPDSGQAMREAARRFWCLHLPGQFAFGIGAPELAGTIGAAAAPRPAGIGLQIGIGTALAEIRGLHRAKCSFRYAPTGVEGNAGTPLANFLAPSASVRVVLIERAKHPYGRLMIDANGELVPTPPWANSKPIDELLPAKKE